MLGLHVTKAGSVTDISAPTILSIVWAPYEIRLRYRRVDARRGDLNRYLIVDLR
jgi:hypothetical protein